MKSKDKVPVVKRRQTRKDDDVYQRLAEAIMTPSSVRKTPPSVRKTQNPEQLERARVYVKKHLRDLAVELDMDQLPAQSWMNSAIRLLNTYENAIDILVRMIRDECVVYVQNLSKKKT